MNKDFARQWQEISDDDLRTMSPEQTNKILKGLDQQVANLFLERLGHIRARDTYNRLIAEAQLGGIRPTCLTCAYSRYAFSQRVTRLKCDLSGRYTNPNMLACPLWQAHPEPRLLPDE